MLHFFAAALSLLVAALLRVTPLELACLTLTISLVLVCELANTALEILCDIICADLEPRIGRVKDIAAGAVLSKRSLSCYRGNPCARATSHPAN